MNLDTLDRTFELWLNDKQFVRVQLLDTINREKDVNKKTLIFFN